MAPAEDMVGAQAKLAFVPFSHNGKPLDRDSIHNVDTWSEFVAPRQVIARAGRQDAYIGVARQVFGDVPRMQFGTSVDVGAVSLHDDRDLHSFSPGPPECVRATRQEGSIVRS